MSEHDDRILDEHQMDEDMEIEMSLRPEYLKQYIGQNVMKNNLQDFIQAVNIREEAMDHDIIHGQPGLGKTTLTNIIAKEMEVKNRSTSGPAIERAGDLAAILSSLEPGDVLFIDEI